MSDLKIWWFDDEIACIDCPCGQTREKIVRGRDPYSGELDRCDSCGRRFRVVQYVEVIEPERPA